MHNVQSKVLNNSKWHIAANIHNIHIYRMYVYLLIDLSTCVCVWHRLLQNGRGLEWEEDYMQQAIGWPGCGGHNRHKDGFSGSWGWLIALLVLRFFCVSRVFHSPCVFIMSFVCIRFQFLMHSCERVCVYICGAGWQPFLQGLRA